MKSISIFGFTGSIGSQALDIIEKHQEAFEIDVFVCKENIDKAINLINVHKPKNVFIHDAARPLNSQKLIKKIIKNLVEKDYDCVIPYTKCTDTTVIDHNNIDREKLKLIKTTQGFIKNKITRLHNKNNKEILTDDSQLFRNEKNKFKIKYLLQNEINIKITKEKPHLSKL